MNEELKKKYIEFIDAAFSGKRIQFRVGDEWEDVTMVCLGFMLPDNRVFHTVDFARILPKVEYKPYSLNVLCHFMLIGKEFKGNLCNYRIIQVNTETNTVALKPIDPNADFSIAKSPQELLEDFTFIDGTPVGEEVKVERTND